MLKTDAAVFPYMDETHASPPTAFQVVSLFNYDHPALNLYRYNDAREVSLAF